MKVTAHILITTFLLVGFSSVTMAQSTDNATITANANVVQDMVVGGDANDIEFNNILLNSTKFINATDGSVDAEARTSVNVDGITGGEERGWFDISIAGGINVDVSLNITTQLKDEHNNSLGFSTSEKGFGYQELNGMLTETKPTGTTPIIAIDGGEGNKFSFAGTTWTLDNAFTMPESGTVYLALGGETFALTDQELGTYSGELTLTATVAD